VCLKRLTKFSSLYIKIWKPVETGDELTNEKQTTTEQNTDNTVVSKELTRRKSFVDEPGVQSTVSGTDAAQLGDVSKEITRRQSFLQGPAGATASKLHGRSMHSMDTTGVEQSKNAESKTSSSNISSIPALPSSVSTASGFTDVSTVPPAYRFIKKAPEFDDDDEAMIEKIMLHGYSRILAEERWAQMKKKGERPNTPEGLKTVRALVGSMTLLYWCFLLSSMQFCINFIL
jgi:hypothetical protein